MLHVPRLSNRPFLPPGRPSPRGDTMSLPHATGPSSRTTTSFSRGLTPLCGFWYASARTPTLSPSSRPNSERGGWRRSLSRACRRRRSSVSVLGPSPGVCRRVLHGGESRDRRESAMEGGGYVAQEGGSAGELCEPAQMYAEACAPCCVPDSVWCVSVDRCIEEISGDGNA